MIQFKRGNEYPHLCPECQSRVTMIAEMLTVGPGEVKDPEAPLKMAARLGLLCAGSKCVLELVPQGQCSVRLREYLEDGTVNELPLIVLPAKAAMHQAERAAEAYLSRLRGGTIFREQTEDYWEVRDALGEPRLVIEITPTGEPTTFTRTKGE